MSSKATDIDLLMIGKTGNGKSALGNTILNRNIFKSHSSTTSVTKEIQYEVSEISGRVIKVVDGPGVGDTRLDNEAATKLVMDAMTYAISVNPRGYHAFLLVVKFGGRFTAEDKDTIEFLKKIFGENFVKDFCILVMTCGDNFEAESEDTNKSFEEWCREQDGVFRQLLQECNNRALLFDNRTKDQSKKDSQLDALIQMVDHLTNQGHRYKDDNFEKARVARERLMVEAKMPVIKEETLRETSLIIQKLQIVQQTVEYEIRAFNLDPPLIRAKGLYESIKTQDNGTGALHDLTETVQSLITTIRDEIKLSERMTQEREKMRIKEDERQKAFEENLRRQSKEYERKMQQEKMAEEKRKQYQRELEEKIKDMENKARQERKKLERESKRNDGRKRYLKSKRKRTSWRKNT